MTIFIKPTNSKSYSYSQATSLDHFQPQLGVVLVVVLVG